MKIAVGIVAVAIVGAIVAVAQMSHKSGFGHHQQGSMNHEQFIDHISEKLKLSDQQKTQAKQIIADTKPRVASLHERLKETHQEAMNLSASGVFDEQKTQQIAARQAEVAKELFVEKARTHAALFAILTPEQREQAKQMMNEMSEHFAH